MGETTVVIYPVHKEMALTAENPISALTASNPDVLIEPSFALKNLYEFLQNISRLLSYTLPDLSSSHLPFAFPVAKNR